MAKPIKLIQKLLKLNPLMVKKSFVGWIPVGIAITGLSGIVYLGVQQTLRMSADDPQIQISEEVVGAIAKGMSASSILPPTPSSDMEKDLGAFVIIYKDSGEALGSSTQLDNQTPKLPNGVLDLVNKKGETRFTWEPKKGVRSAVVAKKYDGGIVLVGKSLREIEKREKLLTLYILAAWGLVMVSSFTSKAILDGLKKK